MASGKCLLACFVALLAVTIVYFGKDEEDLLLQKSRHNSNQDELRKGNVCNVRLLVDHSLYVELGKDREAVSKTALDMLDKVNYIYRHHGPLLAEGKPVQFRVPGKILIAADELCDKPGMSKDLRCSAKEEVTNSSTLLALMELSLLRDVAAGEFCMALLLTARPLSKQGLEGGLAGVAHRSTVCSKDPTFAPIGIVRVGGKDHTVNSALTMAHEIGHLLGAEHDEEGSRYIMAPTLPEVLTREHLRFSAATLDEMNDNLHSLSASDPEKGIYRLPKWVSEAGATAGEVSLFRLRNWCFLDDAPEEHPEQQHQQQQEKDDFAKDWRLDLLEKLFRAYSTWVVTRWLLAKFSSSLSSVRFRLTALHG